MSPGDQAVLLWRFVERTAAQEWDLVRELFASDAAVRFLHGSVVSGDLPTVSADRFVRMARESDEAFDLIDKTVEGIFHADPWVIAQITYTQRQVEPFYGTEPKDEPITASYIMLARCTEDGIDELRQVTDTGVLYRKLGILDDQLLNWKLQQEFYEVLTRLLRHNLRNDLDAVLGYLTEFEGINPETDRLVHRIRGILTGILETAQTVRDLEQRVLDAPIDAEPVEVGELIRTVTATVVEDHPRGTVSTSVAEDGVTVRTDRELLRTLLEELIANAIEHNTNASIPTVTIRARRVSDGDAVEITVADNGPGIPPNEYVPLQRETETQDLHSRGIGLWVVKWITDRLDGELSFETRDPQGSRIRVRLPPLENTS